MEHLETEKFYHIYNRGNNKEDLFQTNENCKHFLFLYDKYISPIAETYAWVLMRNHFRFLVRIKEAEKIGVYRPFNSIDPSFVRFETMPMKNLSESEGPDRVNLRIPNPSKHFSHLFNAYSKYYNTLNNRTGSLFASPFRRKVIFTESYLKNLVIYIHINPVHHEFTDDFTNYPWSSYYSIIPNKPTKICRDKVLNWFDDKANFIEVHKQKLNVKNIEDLLLE